MAILSIPRGYADGSLLSAAILDAAFDEVEDVVNDLDSDNFEDEAISEAKIDFDPVGGHTHDGTDAKLIAKSVVNSTEGTVIVMGGTAVGIGTGDTTITFAGTEAFTSIPTIAVYSNSADDGLFYIKSVTTTNFIVSRAAGTSTSIIYRAVGI